MEARVGFWPRLAAGFIDLVLLCILAVVARKAVTGLFPQTVAEMLARTAAEAKGQEMPAFMKGMMGFTLALSLFTPIYGLIEGLLGASPGKFILGQRIVTEGGARAGQPQLIARYAIKHATSALGLLAVFLGIKALEHGSNVVGAVYLLGCFMVLGKARQALHDKIVGTAVLRTSDLPEPVTTAPLPGAG